VANIATGKSGRLCKCNRQVSLDKKFVEEAFKQVDIEISWEGKGVNEVGRENKTGKVVVQTDPRYFRPTEVDRLLGDPSKARSRLGWEPTVSFSELIKMMIREDLKEAEQDQLCDDAGFQTLNQFE